MSLKLKNVAALVIVGAMSGSVFAAGAGGGGVGAGGSTTGGAGGVASPDSTTSKVNGNTSGYGAPGVTGVGGGQGTGTGATPNAMSKSSSSGMGSGKMGNRTPNGTNTGEMRNGDNGQ